MQCTAQTPTIIVKTETSTLAYRASCNSWNCPACSQRRAKKEYARIVGGIDKLDEISEYPLFFITLTAQSNKTQSQSDALENYGYQTNRLMSAIRMRSVRELDFSPYYVAVTELQRRGYPHTHMLISGYVRRSFYERSVHSWSLAHGYRQRTERLVIGDRWLEQSLTRSGFGNQYDIQFARSSGGLSRYLAKYLFKSLPDQVFPRNWRRVRYSKNFPKLPERKFESSEITVLVKLGDYRAFAYKQTGAVVVSGETDAEREYLLHHLSSMGIRAIKRKSGQA